MKMVMFGEKASLLLFLSFLYITPLVNETDAGEWFGVLRAVVEADDRLPPTAHCLQVSRAASLRSFRVSMIRAVMSASTHHRRTRLCTHELGVSLPELCTATRAGLVEPRTLE